MANGQSVQNIRQLEDAYRQGDVQLSVLRAGQITEVSVPTMELTGRSVTEVLEWGGALFHDIPSYVSYQWSVPTRVSAPTTDRRHNWGCHETVHRPTPTLR